MERYEATIKIEEHILSVIDQGPAIGAEIRSDGSRFSWIDEGFDFGSQGIHLATEADSQGVTVILVISNGLQDPVQDGWGLELDGTAFWPVGTLQVETADVERVPLAQVEPGRYQVRVWVRGIREGVAGLEKWRRRRIEWSSGGREGPTPTPGPNPERWLIRAVRLESA